MWKPLGLGIICVTCLGISYINTNGTCKQHEQQISSLQQKMGFIEELLVAKDQPIEKVRNATTEHTIIQNFFCFLVSSFNFFE